MIADYAAVFFVTAFGGLITAGCLKLVVNMAYQFVAHLNRPTPVFPDNLQCVKCGTCKISTSFHSIRSLERIPSFDPKSVGNLARFLFLVVSVSLVIFVGYALSFYIYGVGYTRLVVGNTPFDDVMGWSIICGLPLGAFLGLSVTPWHAVTYLSCRITHHCKACGFKHCFEASSPQQRYFSPRTPSA